MPVPRSRIFDVVSYGGLSRQRTARFRNGLKKIRLTHHCGTAKATITTFIREVRPTRPMGPN